MSISRRRVLALAAGAVSAGVLRRGDAIAAPDLTVPDGVPVQTFDFESKGIDGWVMLSGRWVVQEVPDAPSGSRVLVQRETRDEFKVIVTPSRAYRDVDVSVKFKPISGRKDASGGIVFRLQDETYYVVRANALEDNLRFYSYERRRRQLASANVKAPALGEWHTLRVVAVGDQVQAWLDGTRYLDHRDRRFTSGQIGLWTKSDSITAFDDLTIRGTVASSPSTSSDTGPRRTAP